MTNPIDRFTQAIAAASIGDAGVFAQDAVLDATVPNWRYTVSGAANIEAEFGRWYADPGRFEEIRRTAIPDGELVEFVLTWEEDGEPHMVHQAPRDRGPRRSHHPPPRLVWRQVGRVAPGGDGRGRASVIRTPTDGTIPIAESVDRLLEHANGVNRGRQRTRSRAAASSGWSSAGCPSS